LNPGTQQLEPSANGLLPTTSFLPNYARNLRNSIWNTVQAIPCTELPKVPLRDSDALHEWARRQDPPVAGLASKPWLAPSVPFEELSDRPRYEVRYAELPDTGGVVVFHRRYFDGEIVDLIEITVID